MADSHQYCFSFSSVLRQHWDKLAAFTSGLHFGRNDVIYAVDDRADAIYLIESGEVKVAQLAADGNEKILGIYQAGDWFGEVCLCETAKRNDQAVAMSVVKVTSFSVRAVLALVKEKPELAFNLAMVFCARLAECQEQLATLAFDGVRERLAKEMLRLSHLPYNQRNNDAVRIPVNLTHQELAYLVNTTRENVTAIMNEFRQNNLVEYRRGEIVVFPDRVQDYLNYPDVT